VVFYSTKNAGAKLPLLASFKITYRCKLSAGHVLFICHSDPKRTYVADAAVQ
jgi:hypothetical protein